MTPLEAALQAIEATNHADDSQRLVVSKCRALMFGYDARWSSQNCEVLEVEKLTQANLFNPATSARSRTFSVAGKIDLLVNRDGRRVLFDHKTTSDDIKDPNSTYWSQLVIEAQPSHYMLLEWLQGRKIDEAVWDVMRKPDIRPKQVSKADRTAATFSRRYCGYAISGESIEAMNATERETLEMYEYRLVQDCITERPQHYFQRRTIPRMDAEIHEHAEEVWAYSQEIITARRFNRHPRNSGACMNYNRPCVFLGICSGSDTTDSPKWTSKAQVHKELELDNTDGRDVLTNSRLTVFKSCRRKHYLSYELGIERVDEDEAEALWFGSLWHTALEAYYLQMKKEQNGNNNNDSATIEAATVGQQAEV